MTTPKGDGVMMVLDSMAEGESSQDQVISDQYL